MFAIGLQIIMPVREKVKKPQPFRLRLEKNLLNFSHSDENDLFVFSGKRRDLLLLGLGSLPENFSASNVLGVSKRQSAELLALNLMGFEHSE
jgi:hypothetical protein